MILNDYLEYPLPATEDLESNPVTYSVSGGPPFIEFNNKLNILELSPTIPA
jgi:hypothetical protein